jgi:hypothetical protein
LSTRPHHSGENSFHSLKVTDLGMDLGKMFDGDLVHTTAGPGFLIG